MRSLQLQLERLDGTISLRQEQMKGLSLQIEAAGPSDLFSTMSRAELTTLEESLHSQQSFIRARLSKDPKGKALASLREELRASDEKLSAVLEYTAQLEATGQEEGMSLEQLQSKHKQLEEDNKVDAARKDRMELRLAGESVDVALPASRRSSYVDHLRVTESHTRQPRWRRPTLNTSRS